MRSWNRCPVCFLEYSTISTRQTFSIFLELVEWAPNLRKRENFGKIYYSCSVGKIWRSSWCKQSVWLNSFSAMCSVCFTVHPSRLVWWSHFCLRASQNYGWWRNEQFHQCHCKISLMGNISISRLTWVIFFCFIADKINQISWKNGFYLYFDFYW